MFIGPDRLRLAFREVNGELDVSKSKHLVFLSLFVALLSLSALLLAFASAPAAAAPGDIPFPDQREAVAAGVAWLIESYQNEDGGFANNYSPDSSRSGTLDAVIAMASAGYNPAAPYLVQSKTAIDYLVDNADGMRADAEISGGKTGKIVLALSAANQDPRDFAGTDWVLTLTEQISPTGQINTEDPFNQSLGILALTAVNEPFPANVVTWLKKKQDEDGSWDDGFGTTQNTDTTALAIMALVAAGEEKDDPAIVDGLNFLAEQQLETGGWKYSPKPDARENANSTALAVQALAAAGQDFYRDDGPWSKNGRSPLTALLSWQNNSGAFQAKFEQDSFDDFYATVQAIPAATGKPLPLPARFEAARQAVACLATLQDNETGGWEQFATFGVNAAGTSRAIQAIAAVGLDPQSAAWTPGAVNAVEALEALTPDYLAAERGGRVGVVMQGVVAAGAPYDVTDFAGFNLPLKLTGYLSPTGEYASTAFGVVAHDEAMLGLLDAEEMVDPTAVDFLLAAHVDGDWGAPDANGISLNALGRLRITVPEAINHLHQTQEADGAWGFGVPSDPSSSSEVVQGLVRQDQNPFSPAWSQIVSGTISNAADVVLAQQAESGCWPNRFNPEVNPFDPFSTTDGVMLLVQQPDWGVREVFLPVINNSAP